MTLVDFVLRGVGLFNEGRFAEAVELLDERVHWYPRLARSTRVMGRASKFFVPRSSEEASFWWDTGSPA